MILVLCIMNAVCGGLKYADLDVAALSFRALFKFYFFRGLFQFMFGFGYMCKFLHLAVGIFDLS